MSEKKHDKTIYNAADIQRYLNGSMPVTDMYALELAALEDPFLADAIEGYDQKGQGFETNTPGDLEDLRGRLKARVASTNENKIIPLFKRSAWKIAAMVLVVAGSVSVIYYLTNTKGSSRDARIATYKKPEQKDSIASATFNKTDTAFIAVNKFESKRSDIKSPPRQALPKRGDTLETNSKMLSSVLASADTFSKRDSPTAQNALKDEVDSLLRKEDAAGKPSIVTFNKSSERRVATAPRSLPLDQEAVPVMGLPAFNRYIESNKRTSSGFINIHGEVVVSFIVGEDSTLSDFTIVKSLSRQTDNEAIRLLKEGPAWQVLKGKKVKTSITIKF